MKTVHVEVEYVAQMSDGRPATVTVTHACLVPSELRRVLPKA